jgi:histidinol-phosphate/aromatic aminotransferase/cobyric acid decarboxylase-like protein
VFIGAIGSTNLAVYACGFVCNSNWASVAQGWKEREAHSLSRFDASADPTYGEYAHVLENTIGCRVDRLRLRREDDFDLPIERLGKALRRGYDLVVLVNPNNPTGRYASADGLKRVVDESPPQTRFWIDEAYIDFLGPEASLERFASTRNNVFVCKSMSKCYALSGLRVGYLCGEPQGSGEIQAITPPWVVGLPAQVAAVEALRDPVHYAGCYQETHALREDLAAALGLETLPSRTNGFLAFLPEDGPTASEVVRACRMRGLYLRDAGITSPRLGRHSLRFAVKDGLTNVRMVAIFAEVLHELAASGPDGSFMDQR